mmetsp:Transcript_1967/g.4875  ORF Transcript_1967/g.4875 Transcript_1967/m.4875 type:complete len:407 (+) Transcript_1967:240-1460(+)
MTSKATAAATLLSLLALTSGFQLPSTNHVISPTHCHNHNRRTSSSSHLSMSTETEVEKLRAAAAKAREEYERLSKEMGKDVTSTAARVPAPVKKNLSVDEVQAIAKTISFESGDATTQSQALDDLVDSGDFSMWKSAVRRGPTTASSAMSLLVPFSVTLGSLESRTDGKVTGPSLGIGGDKDVSFEDFKDLTVAVVLGSTVLGILALAVLPENVGATFTYLFALIPIGFIGIGSVSPGIIAGVIVAARGESEDAERQRERICRHEAGHFLCGYLCGLPVKNYEISADTGVACVEFHTTANDAPAGQELSEDLIAALSVVAMSGSVAEIIAYEKATGGENDLLELQNCFRKSKEFIGAAKQQDLTRWGALTSYGLIKANKEKYEGLVQAFQEKKSLSDCVSIIEGTA